MDQQYIVPMGKLKHLPSLIKTCCQSAPTNFLAISVKIINTVPSVAQLIDDLSDAAVDPPSLFVDLEWETISRKASILIITLYVEPKNVIYLIDIWVLQGLTFTTRGWSQKTLKDVLESDSIPKVFFDIRNDFAALQGQYGISLRGVQDVQLMEKALHPVGFYGGNPGTSLAKCIEKDVVMPESMRLAWTKEKAKGKRMFHRGSFHAFKVRPMQKDIVAYCAGDVQFLSALWKTYWNRLTPDGKRTAEVEARLRVGLLPGTEVLASPPG